MKKYNHSAIEKKWRKAWDEASVYRTTEDPKKEKFYILDMFPYPSGAGLHVGHPKGYIATDIISRYKRMKGFNVLHPMGWDAFGLPAEQHALKHKIHPRTSTDQNIATYKKQLEQISLDYDWEREISTTDPEFYKWTQWAFIQMFKKGFVYHSEEPINWCPSCKTGLANEDLEGGVCERCGTEVEKKPIPQWVIKITDYADRLLEDLDKLDWQEHIKELQRNWIGKSEGALIKFTVYGGQFTDAIEVFTTRPDTLFGATYLVLSPEHKEVTNLKTQVTNKSEVEKYINEAQKKTEIERTAEGKEKTGVKLEGVTAINPANNKEIPIFIADYVLAHYGTGAIMAVPAHDERDFEFAKKFDLPIKEVVLEEVGKKLLNARRRDGFMGIIENEKGEVLIQYSKLHENYRLPGGGSDNGETDEQAVRREVVEETGYNDFSILEKVGSVWANYPAPLKKINRERVVNVYKIKLNSEQQQEVQWTSTEDLEHNWMAPKEAFEKLSSNPFSLGEDVLFERYMTANHCYIGMGKIMESGKFDGMDSEEAKKAITEFVGGEMTTTYRLNDWVFARQRYWGEPIPLVHCEKCGWQPVPESELPLLLPDVESYEPTGTGESPLAAIKEWVNTKCPECGGDASRETNTMPQWAGSSWYYLRYIYPKNDDALVEKEKEKYWSPVDFYVGGAEHATRHLIYARFWHKFLYDIGVVAHDEPFKKLQTVGLIMAEDGRKMSKRWGNVINPDEIIENYGADTLRVYEMFMGPFDQSVAWSTDGLMGPRRFLEKVWKIGMGLAGESEENASKSLEPTIKTLHKLVKKSGEDIEQMKYNTAVAAMMSFVNVVESHTVSKEDFKTFLTVLSPFAPHIAQELWEALGGEGFVMQEKWPEYDASKIVDDTVMIAVQVNGKVRAEIEVPAGADEADVRSDAEEKIQKWLESGEVKKVIYVPDRLINFVI